MLAATQALSRNVSCAAAPRVDGVVKRRRPVFRVPRWLPRQVRTAHRSRRRNRSQNRSRSQHRSEHHCLSIIRAPALPRRTLGRHVRQPRQRVCRRPRAQTTAVGAALGA